MSTAIVNQIIDAIALARTHRAEPLEAHMHPADYHEAIKDRRAYAHFGPDRSPIIHLDGVTLCADATVLRGKVYVR